MNGMFGIDCGDKWLGRWPDLALRDLWTQAVGLGYANGWPFWAEEIPTSLLPKVVGYKKAFGPALKMMRNFKTHAAGCDFLVFPITVISTQFTLACGAQPAILGDGSPTSPLESSMSKPRMSFRSLRFESLEDRALLDSTGLTGGSQPISQMQPSLALNYIIATSGIFPSRDRSLDTSDSSGDPYLGEVRLFAGSFAPNGYAFAHGQTLPISQNTALFTLLGTSFGGNGSTSFRLPDLRGRVPVKAGIGPGLSQIFVGQSFGSETNVLTVNQLPAHLHTTSFGNTQTSGSAEPFSNQQPSLGLTIGMASEGIFQSISEYRFFAQNFDWSPDYANGQAITIANEEPLFARLGTTYGGNGVTTFNGPDVRGRSLVGSGQGPGLSSYSLGQSPGLVNTVLVSGNLPEHSHTIGGQNTGTAGLPNPTPYSQIQPSIAARYYIRTQGVFPSQGGSGGAGEPYLGEVRPFAADVVGNSSWTPAEGQLISIGQNSALFAIFGTTYGGNGSTTFALPDLRGRIPVGAGQAPGLSNYFLGQTIGSESTTLTVPTLAQHAHTFFVNDQFVNSIPLTGATATSTGSNIGFTGEVGEPNHATLSAPLASAWWNWTAPIDGPVTIHTLGSNFDTTLAVYAGSSLNALSLLAENNDFDGQQSQVVINATAGTVYRIAVDGRDNATGNINLFITQANDAFSNRFTLSGASVSTTGSNVGFTGESLEPSNSVTAPLSSAWWSWTAPINGVVTINTEGSNFDTTLAVFQGLGVNTLTEVAFNDDTNGLQSQVVFNATAGTVYHIAVDGFGTGQGSIQLSLTIANDSFANRFSLLGNSTNSTGSNVGFTGEVGEPNHANLSEPNASAWWQWTAPGNGTVTLNTAGSDFDTTLAVYTGTSVTALTLVAANDDFGTVQSQVTFVATAGMTYIIAVDGFAASTGNIVLSLNQANDVVVLNRHVFYSGATGASASNDAIDTSKSALRTPGAPSTFANYTNYVRGLNGIMIDIAGLPTGLTNSQMLATLQFARWNGIDAVGFSALPIAAVPTLTLLPGIGVGGSTRVKITFPDNTLRNTWLRVTVSANATTGLASDDVFYFGNVVGDLNFGNTATRLRVNGQDTNQILLNQSPGANSASVTNIYDLDRNGRVNGQDTNILLTNQQAAGIVAPISVPLLMSASFVAPLTTKDGLDVVAPLTLTNGSNQQKSSRADQVDHTLIATKVSQTKARRVEPTNRIPSVQLLSLINRVSDKAPGQSESELEEVDNYFATLEDRFVIR